MKMADRCTTLLWQGPKWEKIYAKETFWKLPLSQNRNLANTTSKDSQMMYTSVFQTRNLVLTKSWKTLKQSLQVQENMKIIALLVIWDYHSTQCQEEGKTMCLLRDNVTELESLLVVHTTLMTKAQRRMDQHILFRRVEEMEILVFLKIHQEQGHITLTVLLRSWKLLRLNGVWEVVSALDSNTLFHQHPVLVLMKWERHLVWICLVIQSVKDNLMFLTRALAQAPTSPWFRTSSKLLRYFL